jgi:hypothetical protein
MRLESDIKRDVEDELSWDPDLDAIDIGVTLSQAAAKFNLRDVMESWDLPITKGLQESIHGFTKLDEQIELEPILEGIAAAAARSRVRRRDPFEATVIRISTIPRRSTGRPPSGCSICCCESDISKSEGHRLKGDFSD